MQEFAEDQSFVEKWEVDLSDFDLQPGDRLLVWNKDSNQKEKLQTPWVPGVVLQQPVSGVHSMISRQKEPMKNQDTYC